VNFKTFRFASPSTQPGASTPARRPFLDFVLRRIRGQPDSRVPSSRFRTAPTASSAPGSRVCCTPLPILRFAAFLAGLLLFEPEGSEPESSQREGAFPVARFIPLEGVPSFAAASRHRDRDRPAVGLGLLRFVGFTVLLRERVRCESSPLPEPFALSFLGFVPLQGSPRVRRVTGLSRLDVRADESASKTPFCERTIRRRGEPSSVMEG
jgi:hypothetical protein